MWEVRRVESYVWDHTTKLQGLFVQGARKSGSYIEWSTPRPTKPSTPVVVYYYSTYYKAVRVGGSSIDVYNNDVGKRFMK